jgi:hypothetical protein
MTPQQLNTFTYTLMGILCLMMLFMIVFFVRFFLDAIRHEKEISILKTKLLAIKTKEDWLNGKHMADEMEKNGLQKKYYKQKTVKTEMEQSVDVILLQKAESIFNGN